jgi:hypothetical protein
MHKGRQWAEDAGFTCHGGSRDLGLNIAAIMEICGKAERSAQGGKSAVDD